MELIYCSVKIELENQRHLQITCQSHKRGGGRMSSFFDYPDHPIIKSFETAQSICQGAGGVIAA